MLRLLHRLDGSRGCDCRDVLDRRAEDWSRALSIGEALGAHRAPADPDGNGGKSARDATSGCHPCRDDIANRLQFSYVCSRQPRGHACMSACAMRSPIARLTPTAKAEPRRWRWSTALSA